MASPRIVTLAGALCAALAAAAPGPPAAARQDDPRLEALFAALRASPDPSAARDAANRIREIWMKSGEPRLDRLMTVGRAAMIGGNHAAALSHFDRVVAADPGYAEGWNQRAALHYLTGDYAASVRDAERALELEPRHFDALSGLGLIDARSGRLEKAVERFEGVLRMNPHARHARSNIAWLRGRMAAGGGAAGR